MRASSCGSGRPPPGSCLYHSGRRDRRFSRHYLSPACEPAPAGPQSCGRSHPRPNPSSEQMACAHHHASLDTTCNTWRICRTPPDGEVATTLQAITMKHRKETIRVRCSSTKPLAFRRAAQQNPTYVIRRILRAWIVQTAWWTRETRHTYYEVVTAHGVYIICCRCRAQNLWYLVGIRD